LNQCLMAASLDETATAVSQFAARQAGSGTFC
jgi:hypothetical protein